MTIENNFALENSFGEKSLGENSFENSLDENFSENSLDEKSSEKSHNKNSSEKTLEDFSIGFVGLGLMGGSFAKAFKKQYPHIRLYAFDQNAQTIEDAKKIKLIEEGYSDSPLAMLQKVDLVFISLYPSKVFDFIIQYENDFKSGSIITDITGVKSSLEKKLANLSRSDISVILGHPMAGSEKEGFSHASEKIFHNRNYIFINSPLYKNANSALFEKHLSLLKKLALDIGFSRIIETTNKMHDHKIAFTSQLCHVIASALVESAEDTEITSFGGGSYEDLTRIAMINAPLWTELFLANKTELIKHINVFEKSLDNLKQFIENDEVEKLEKTLQNVREKRIAMTK